MIYGIGTDLVEPARIARLLEKYGDRFAKRLLTDEEWPEYVRSTQPAMFLAKRFAAKEALSKAIGTGMRYPVSLNHIGINHDSRGKPYFSFHPELSTLVRNEGITGHHLSISDELNLACAFVVLEK
ncbi:holo-ACP synthase [Nitrosovibrio tenuis]|uniref:Holo-[acyl-carrier-protein] synthase n=1 Tax=Nitrosovibrio tenuis TaxID=1233 RepID=A0A1H7IAY8_9PROT|nr:holo-ACP synthase [Nitrosovibrio tenuis]SEK59666.1 holo-[acyl-carrier protein] synthase [Nitrosovibrio tenuis]